MGTSDLAKDLHAGHTRDRMPMITSLGICLLAARAYGLAILDGVHLDLRDDEGLAYSCRQGLNMGFDGKTLIHPRTLAIANEVFSPSPEEVDWSRKIIEAHAAAVAEGKGVAVYEGKLIENLHVENAQRMVALAAAIEARDGNGRSGRVNAAKRAWRNPYYDQDQCRPLLRGFQPRTDPDPCHAAHGDRRRPGADRALYLALTGTRFALSSSDPFAASLGYPRAPLDDLLAFHLVFGKTVPDISLNAIANLGYASCIFKAPLYDGDTVTAESRVIGLKENSNRKTGVVYVRSLGRNQRGEAVLDYVRWVMVRKRDPSSPDPVVPELPDAVPAGDLVVPPGLDLSRYCAVMAGAPHLWDDYAPGERIDHVDGMTIEEAEHQMATRLYQNTA
jgi:acyl dehydratase